MIIFRVVGIDEKLSLANSLSSAAWNPPVTNYARSPGDILKVH